MFAYRSLRDIEKTYKQAGSPGVHLYEKGDKKWKTYLPSPLPATCIIDSYEDQRIDRSRIDSVKEAYEYALENKILVPNDYGAIEIPVIPAVDFDEMEAMAKQGDEARNNVIDRLEEMQKNFLKDREMKKVTLPSGIDPRRRATANLDILVKYTLLGRELKNTVAIHKQLAAMISKLCGESDVNRKKYLDLFIQAVYAGIIKTNGSIFKYVYELDGLPEEKMFTSATKEYNKIPIYQAADEFAAMKDVRLRKRIEGETAAVLDQTISDSLISTAKKLENFFDVERLQEYMDEAVKTDRNDEIKEFLGTWKKSLRKFIKDSEVGAEFF